jgi:lipopolysaccharide transport system ATP-binding protein
MASGRKNRVPAIKVQALGKQYVIGGRAQHNETFREALVSSFAAPFRRFRQLSGSEVSDDEQFWALKGVAFDVDEGEVVGIIGRNGAGKSTLLKVLSRITDPTEGRIEIRGRVASLLEVGTGFHPELTGRENIYLNGGVLGMSRREIDGKFDAIVDFSGVSKFLDTPVKRYSSGMSVRLAFSVAAHLDPEILLVDEVLAVGDAEFQRKCLGKMQEVAGAGRTVLFVSHNLNAVERLCDRVVWLEHGKIRRDSENVRNAISDYLMASGSVMGNSQWMAGGNLHKNEYFVPLKLSVANASSDGGGPLSNRYPIVVEVEGQVRNEDPALNIGLGVYDEENNLLFWTFTSDQSPDDWPELKSGHVRLRTRIPERLLNEGNYRIELLASLHRRLWVLEAGRDAPSITFSIQGGLSDSPLWDRKRPGILAPVIEWEAF